MLDRGCVGDVGFLQDTGCHESAQPHPAGAKAAGFFRAEFDGSILMFHWQVKIFSQGGEGTRARAVKRKQNNSRYVLKQGLLPFHRLTGDFYFRKKEVDSNSTKKSVFLL